MRNQLLLVAAMVLFISRSVFGAVSEPQASSFDFSDIANFPVKKVWKALLHTLEQQQVSVISLDSSAYSLATDYIYLSVDSSSALYERHFKDQLPQKSSLFEWREIRYLFEIDLVDIDSTHTRLLVRPQPYIYESYFTRAWHLLEPIEDFAREFIQQVYASISAVESMEPLAAVRESDRFVHYGAPSGDLTRVLDYPEETVWRILQKLIKGSSFHPKVNERYYGLIVTEFLPLVEKKEKSLSTKQVLMSMSGNEYLRERHKKSGLLYVAVAFHVGRREESDAGTRVVVEIFLERYKDEKWQRLESTGYLETRLLSALQSALSALGTLDQHTFSPIHLTSQKTSYADVPITAVWNAVLNTFSDLSLKMKAYRVDSTIVARGDSCCPEVPHKTVVLVGVRKLGGSRTRLDLCVSDQPLEQDYPRLGIEYLPSVTPFETRFMKTFESNLSGVETAWASFKEPVIEIERDKPFANSRQSRFMVTLNLYQVIDFLPDFDLVRSELLSDSTLSLEIRILQPFESEKALSKPHVAELLARKVLAPLAFALQSSVQDSIEVDKFLVEVLFKLYVLDDQTPLNNRYHRCTIEVSARQLRGFANLDLGLNKLIQSCLISLDGEDVTMTAPDTN